jgi:hypothetical protein
MKPETFAKKLGFTPEEFENLPMSEIFQLLNCFGYTWKFKNLPKKRKKNV